MKRMSFARRNALFPRGAKPWGIGLIVVAIILVALRFAFPSLLVTIASPLWKAGQLAASATHDTSAYFSDPKALQEELDNAHAQNEALANQNLTLAGKVSDLEHLLGEREAASPGILAGVVLRPPVSPYDTLVIDAGFKDGVVVGALVEGPGGAPIGTIGSVATDSARVILYSSYGVSTSAWAGEERTPLTLMGEGGGAFSATASSEAPLTVGEAISLPVGGAGVMGVIDRIDKDPSSPEAEVRIRPLVNPYSITWVTVSHSAPTAP